MDFATLYTKTKSARALKTAWRLVADIGKLEAKLKALSDRELRTAFLALKDRASEDRVTEGFALVREVSARVLGLRQFDVQLIGGLTLLQGRLAEMRTGEGKTLTIAAPAAVLALEGKGVHVVTANSYLAQRDAALMAPLYEALGLTVAFVDDGQTIDEKKSAYAADITYGVGHEFGFDYLKDNLVRDKAGKVQRGLHAAIVDEVDSILIDEARVPLIISAQASDVGAVVRAIGHAVKGLRPQLDYETDQKEKQVTLTESGYAAVEVSLVEQGIISSAHELYDGRHLALVRRIHSAAKAHGLFRRDRDYVVEGGELVLVDQGTGRKMPGRRFDDGLHEALEEKEGLQINPGTLTRATITYQNFFGQYASLAGLTGTALTDADEFAEIYNLETVAIPTNKPIARKDLEDLVFLTKAQKFSAAVAEIKARQQKGQPVLVGCATIRDAEVMGRMLSDNGVAHEVLTAKYLEREAHIIAQAGRKGSVTVATNMAGRGTDILLGGEKPSKSDYEDKADYATAIERWEAAREEVLALGGLFVLGTERNGLRRVDNQLAGRSGRQGDPGEVQFYLSLEDELLKVFGTSGKLGLVRRMVEASGSALSGKQVVKMVTASQQKFESQGFEARKTLMKFDSVLASQRTAAYALRDALLEGGALEHCKGAIESAMECWADEWLNTRIEPETWDLGGAKKDLQATFGLSVPLVGWVHKEALDREMIVSRLVEAALAQFDVVAPSEEQCRLVVFGAMDELWSEHLTALDELRSAANLKGHTGLNPVYQFHKEAFDLFHDFEKGLSVETAAKLLNVDKQKEQEEKANQELQRRKGDTRVAVEAEQRWIRRNDICPCGSGMRFKECHGKIR